MAEAPTLPPPPAYGAEAAAAEAEQTRLTITLKGHEFRYRTPVPMGALAVFATRLESKNELTQASAYVKFLRAWFIPEDHDAIDDMIEQVIDLSTFTENELASIVEVAAGRPT